MKIAAAVAILVSCMPALGFAQQHASGWTFPKFPVDGLSDITFPFGFSVAPRQSGYHFTQQFTFQNVSNIQFASAGIQPRADVGGKPTLLATFESFIPGTTTTNANCRGGNGITGITCALQVTANYADRYSVVVVNTQGTTWRGSLLDNVTNKSTVIGDWTLPKGTGKIVNGGAGYVDYYPWNNNENVVCNTLPFTEVSFYGPVSTNKAAIGGTYRVLRPVGQCVNQVQLAVTTKTTSFRVKLGFR
ncbi:hypothetical protein BGZ99_000546 [Dissophora globulifera]|uniref:Uncharacterized protein n=1 Tax=Dissophora globulifera TaxID=979702 RepID=A0A9P6ULG6_9FUNG|nr:hypothetical protein BGZ99_000546 [Dissophora globulifera]